MHSMPPEGQTGATSVDGHAFTYSVPVDLLDVRTGGYVKLDHPSGQRLGQVTGIAPAVEGQSLARVAGRILAGGDAPFHGAAPRVATPAEINAWLDAARPHRARLDVGVLTASAEIPFSLDAGAFDRHTFLCGQSGSGKTYALGTILERLLVETSLRIVILDPNSDFYRLAELRDDVPAEVAERYRSAAEGVNVRSGDPSASGSGRLHIRFRDFDAAEQAAVLRLDPIADRDEYSALAEALESKQFEVVRSVREVVDLMWAHPDPLHSLGIRARNLGIDDWQVWSAGDGEALSDLVAPGGPRCVVVDLGSLPRQGEQAAAAEATLAALWRRRGAREPMLIVIDEAHNVCPGNPADPLTALATEHAVRIAGEGRKFGLILLVSTQRPQKVHENVVSQCDNLVLMRMNSRSDLAALAETFSAVPSSLLGLATEFRQGEAIVSGKLVPGPTLGRFGPRWSVEGGADVPSDWADAR